MVTGSVCTHSRNAQAGAERRGAGQMREWISQIQRDPGPARATRCVPDSPIDFAKDVRAGNVRRQHGRYRMQTTRITPHIFAALAVILAANSGLTTQLGAHPFWAVQTAWVGVPAGLALAVLLKWIRARWLTRAITLCMALGLSFALAHFGKERFAASFAEDRAAGQAWFYGWIAVMTFATAAIATIFSSDRDQAGG